MAKSDVFEAGGISLKLTVPHEVYEPSDDSELIAKIAIDECHGSVLEIGCGSGAVCILLAKAGRCQKILAVDINPDAVKCANANADANLTHEERMRLKIIESDLFENLGEGEKFDWIVFNPPYLPTADEERLSGKINHAYDGGEDGLFVVQQFLASAPSHLKKGGKALLVASSLQAKKELDALFARLGYKHEVLAEEKFFFEKLRVLKLWRD